MGRAKNNEPSGPNPIYRFAGKLFSTSKVRHKKEREKRKHKFTQQLNSSTLPASLLRFEVITAKWCEQSLQL